LHAIKEVAISRISQRQSWIRTVGAKTAYITPGSSWENGFCENFNARFSDKLLSDEKFYSLKEAQIIIEQWRKHHNTIRPHSELGYRPPAPGCHRPNGPQTGHALTFALKQGRPPARYRRV
jgi:transposase InsO family protein